MHVKKITTSAFVLVMLTVPVACGSAAEPNGGGPASANPASPTSPAPAVASAVHNAADVAFAQGMIPHHAQAVRMAELAPRRAASNEVKRLAAAIRAAQQPEIDQLTTMLNRWGAPVAAPGTEHGADHGGMHHSGTAPGMMSGADMAKLEKAAGPDFDRQFLTMMIAHHEGAVSMSATELRDGRDLEATALARKITDTQRDEIDRMRRLLSG